MNAQTKHSSGPWVAVELHDADQPWAIIPSRQPIAASVANKTLDIAAIWPRGGKKMAEANARLIAAAPEQHDALIVAYRVMDEVRAYLQQNDFPSAHCCHNVVF